MILLQRKNNFASLKKGHGAGIPQDSAKFIQLFLASKKRSVTVCCPAAGERVGTPWCLRAALTLPCLCAGIQHGGDFTWLNAL